MLLDWTLQLARRLRPREGWAIFLLGWFTLLTVALAAGEAAWVPDVGWLLAATLSLGYLAAFGLSRVGTRRPALAAGAREPAEAAPESDVRRGRAQGVLAALVLAALGLLVVSLVAAWGEAPAVAEEVRWYFWLPVRIGLTLREMAQRLWDWAQGVRAGGAAQDDLVFGWLLGLVGWAVASWAGWWLFRRRQPLIALLPAGVVLATDIFFAWKGRYWLPVFLGGVVLLMVLVRRHTLEARWQREGIGYSEAMRFDSGMAAMGLAVIAVILSMTMPRVVFTPTARWFYRLAREPVSVVEDAGRQLFPGLRRSPRSLLASGGGPGGLPRSFLLGSGPELSEQRVLQVRTDEVGNWRPDQPLPGEFRHYWRAVTFDLYDGRGWRNGPVETEAFGAGEPWQPAEAQWRRPLRQSIEVLRGGDQAIFAAGEPLAPDRGYEAQVRSPTDAPAADLVALLGDSRRYDVISLVPAAAEATLRAAGGDYPPGVAERYLALPEVPPRVHDLAQELAGGVGSPYDQALIVEDYLRDFTYDLGVAPPPPGRDVADYFLFEAQAGYCDYYATAMVVLARSLGIPARLAVGYTTGDFDPQAGLFMVAEDSAHSWPELYFPEVGWVPFEPTAGRPQFVRVGLPDAEPDQALAAQGVAADLQVFREDEIIRSRVRGLAMGFAVAVLAIIGWIWWRRRPEPGLVALYERMGRWGQRLGRPPGPGETAGQFGRGLQAQILAEDEEPQRLAAAGVGEFVANFEAAQYSAAREQPAAAARRVWRGLIPALRRLWLGRLGRRNRRRPT